MSVFSTMKVLLRLSVLTLISAGFGLAPMGAISAPVNQSPLPPPWVETSNSTPTDDAAVIAAPAVSADSLSSDGNFQSVAGGLPVGPEHGLVMDGVEVQLASGTLAYGPESDILVSNPQGSDAIFQRSYRSNCALVGYGSPGLPVGWVHNYDLKIVAVSKAGSWGSLELVYPTGARDTLVPTFNGSGDPTGEFKSGAFPFVATGRPAAQTGTWKDLVLHWNDQGEWRFRPSLAHPGTYTLYMLSGLEISYDAKGRIKSVANHQSPKSPLITWNYDAAGYLQSVASADGLKVDYIIEPFGKSSMRCLRKVSFKYSKTQPADSQPHYTFDYQDIDSALLLKEVTMPSPTGAGRAACTFVYDDGRVHSFTTPEGTSHEYQYSDDSTAINIKDNSGKVLMTWTQLWDSLGRNTGNIDSRGNKSTIGYQ